MTPKEKANDIFDKMYQNQELFALKGNHTQFGNARKCSLLLVEEIMKLNCLELMDKTQIIKGLEPTPDFLDYWMKVQQEIKNI
jgi:hypothetical protein